MWKMGAWVVQEGRWGYLEHFPKIWCGGVECEEYIALKVTRNENGWRRKKHKDPAKFGVWKKKKKLVMLVFEPETRPLDHKYLRKGSRCLNSDQLYPYIGTWSSIQWWKTTKKRYC